ncbi:testis-specific gene A8 protein-like isoform X2 [Salarias fasciatus]|uniref:testis-specific gene A8 protein-like isoform X2 n=1 Tax=Salarias fasciatus TaxID=181472 RepID=UPI0011767502|nr:testis-specific gene A8 protein-like isoform X2 [Salarias fasciatus]
MKSARVPAPVPVLVLVLVLLTPLHVLSSDDPTQTPAGTAKSVVGTQTAPVPGETTAVAGRAAAPGVAAATAAAAAAATAAAAAAATAASGTAPAAPAAPATPAASAAPAAASTVRPALTASQDKPTTAGDKKSVPPSTQTVAAPPPPPQPSTQPQRPTAPPNPSHTPTKSGLDPRAHRPGQNTVVPDTQGPPGANGSTEKQNAGAGPLGSDSQQTQPPPGMSVAEGGQPAEKGAGSQPNSEEKAPPKSASDKRLWLILLPIFLVVAAAAIVIKFKSKKVHDHTETLDTGTENASFQSRPESTKDGVMLLGVKSSGGEENAAR